MLLAEVGRISRRRDPPFFLIATIHVQMAAGACRTDCGVDPEPAEAIAGYACG